MNPLGQKLPPPDPPDFVGTVDEGEFFTRTADPSAEPEPEGDKSYFAPTADPSAEDDEGEGSFFAGATDPSVDEDEAAESGFRVVETGSGPVVASPPPSSGDGSEEGRTREDKSPTEADRVQAFGKALADDPSQHQAQQGGPELLEGPRSAPSEGVEVSRLDNDHLRALAKELEHARRTTPDSPEQAADQALLERTENKIKTEMAARGMLTDAELRLEHMLVEHRLHSGEARAGDLEYAIRLKWEILTRLDHAGLLAEWDSVREFLDKGDDPRRAVDEAWRQLLEQQLTLREMAVYGGARKPWLRAQPGESGALVREPEYSPPPMTISDAQLFNDFLNALPYAGAAKALEEGFAGRNAITGEELSGMERVLNVASGGYEVAGPAFSGRSREPSKANIDSTVPEPPASALSPPPDQDLVWVNKSSSRYHTEESYRGQRVEQDADRGVHWEKMSREQAASRGFEAARTGDPIREQALGRERVADFLTDYVEGGRDRMFNAPANPQAIHQEVPLYSKLTVDGKDYYVQSDPRRTLDIVDLTDAEKPKTFEIGTQTPSRKEIGRKDDQTAAWEAAREEAQDLRRQGGDGKVYGRLANGTFVDLTTAEYFIPPDVRHHDKP